ncbi:MULTISPECIES: hypothetical protein [unclassified Streptomyces]
MRTVRRALLAAVYGPVALVGPIVCAVRDPLKRRWNSRAATYWEFTRS